MIDSEAINLIFALVEDLAEKNYHQISEDGRIGRLTEEELKIAIDSYGCKLVSLPHEAVGIFDACKVEGKREWQVDVPLWTEEEGRSDLTLSVSIDFTNGKKTISIDDLRVP